MKILGRRRAAAIRLAELYRVSRLQAQREVLDPAQWLIVLANILSSAPPKWLGDRRGERAPEFFGLNEATLSRAMRNAGIRVTNGQVAEQVAATTAWRKKESKRLGRPHYVAMSGATIGLRLLISGGVRNEAKAWSIRPFGYTKEMMVEDYQERDRERKTIIRRAKNIKPRAHSLSRTKPWEKLGMCRRTYERKRAAGTLADAVPMPSKAIN